MSTQALSAPDNPILTAVVAAQQRHSLFPTKVDDMPTPVVVAVSGGADSICLLHVLRQLAEVWRLTLHVAHLDHALRPESADEAAFVAQLAQRWQLPFHSKRLTPGVLETQARGLEDAARRARYTFLTQIAINVTTATKVPFVALAHQADDQAETVLLHLIRGSGLRGLAGMRWVTLWTEHQRMVQLVRPLLGVRRRAILDYLKTYELPWCEDARNQDLRFARNRLRHLVLPELEQINPGVVETLARTAEVLAAEVERSEQMDRQALQRLLLNSGESDQQAPVRVVLDLDQLVALDLASQRGVMRQALALLEPELHGINFAQVESLLDQLHHHPQASGPHPLDGAIAWTIIGASGETPACLSLHRSDGLPLQPEHPYLDVAWRQEVKVMRLPQTGSIFVPGGWALRAEMIAHNRLPIDWQQRGQPWRVFLDADQVGVPILTTSRPGLRFAPLGLQGQQKSLGDFFTDRKVPAALRSGWPLILDQSNDAIVWVCGLALGHQGRITEQTTRVLCLQWLKEVNDHAR